MSFLEGITSEVFMKAGVSGAKNRDNSNTGVRLTFLQFLLKILQQVFCVLLNFLASFKV